jgi:hypothetical protein
MPLLSVPQPSPVHNGAKLLFGPDGYLYAGYGDGGRYNDPNNNAQNGQTLLGAILRLDVDDADPGKNYGVPADNPYVSEPTVLDEIWSMGLRNPWRFSFDTLTGDLYIGDVGGQRYEEINLERAPLSGGVNYGWRCYEGPVANITEGCLPPEAYEFPIFVLPHSEVDPTAGPVCAVIGGVVHRGAMESPIYGKYLLADYCSGRLWAIEEVQQGQWQPSLTLQAPHGYVSAFGQDQDGEVYVASLGTIYRIDTRSVVAFPESYLPSVSKGG